MKSSTKRIFLVLLIATFFLSITRFAFPFFKLKEYLYGLVLMITFTISILLLGYNKNRNSREKNMSIAILVFTLLFQVLTFVLFGLKLGFLTSSYHLGFTHFFKIVLPLIIILLSSEILRYQLIEKGRNSKSVIIAVTIFFILLETLISSNLYDLTTFKNWFEFSSIIIFPAIMKNILLTYLVYHYGYKPTIIYRLIIELPIYYLPIFPDIGNYLNCILNISFPFFILLYSLYYTKNVEFSSKDKDTENVNQHKKSITIFNIFLLLFLFICVGLMSGIFKYYFLVVGSGSMEPKISKGDMVLVEKTKKYEELKIGDVLVYKNNNKVIIHRITNINKEEGKFIFQTKGDNNTTEDAWIINENDVIGKVNFKLSKIGYPSVWLNELFEGGK